MDKDKEAILVKLAQSGDEGALIALYQNYVNPIYSYVYCKVGDQPAAEDITSEVFLKMVKGWRSFKGQSSFKNWLYQITKNTVADYWRAHYQKSTVPIEEFLEINLVSESREDDIEQELAEKEKRVSKILNALPENYRQILELRFLKGYLLKDIAQQLNITISNVKVLQYRALKKAYEIFKNI